MLERIRRCKDCELGCYQEPLLDWPKKRAVVVVGLSAKKITTPSEIPLDNGTKSGQLVMEMEKISAKNNLEVYRTNLVKCPPLDERGKLRYPTNAEIEVCFENLLHEIDVLDPRIVVLFGNIVQAKFERKLGISIGAAKKCTLPYLQNHGRYYVASYHPSYIMRSKERQKMYIENFEEFLRIYMEREGPSYGL